MSIRNKIGQTGSITSESQALLHFTDRYPLTRLFAHYLNDSQPRDKILFFYGDGGNGKSLLLRYLRERCCKRLHPNNWAYLTTLSDEEFVVNLEKAEDAEVVPCVMLDFGMQPRGEDRPQEAFSALLMLRRALSGQGLHFPLYDFASVWYLYRTNQLSKERLANLFPAEEMDLVTALSDTILTTLNTTTFGLAGLAKAMLGVVNKHAGQKLNERFTLFLQKRNLDEAQVQRITQMDPDKELINELPILFAEDLNTSMAMSDAPERLVLCFDTHEAFWGNQRDLSSELHFQRDEWLRRLMASLELERGIVAVVAGRDRPRWPEATDEQGRIPKEYIDAQLVGHLSDTDALLYLNRVGVANEPLCLSLLEAARVGVDEIHPYYLGLCVDIVQAAAAKSIVLTPDDFTVDPKLADKERTLVNRLLKYVDSEIKDAIYALSACRSFDWDIYRTLGYALDFHVTRAAFDVLTQFSFVRRSEQRGTGWYRVHDLLRRLLYERGEARVQQAHAEMERFYTDRANTGHASAIIEAVYHINRQDWARGIETWVDLFERAFRSIHYGFCQAMLEVRTELLINNDFEYGRTFGVEGNYLARLSRYDGAKLAYEQALAAYNAVLLHTPDFLAAYNNKGNVLRGMGEVHMQLTQYEAALAIYAQAVEVLSTALQHAPDYVHAHDNKGLVLRSMGDVWIRLAQYEAAHTSYIQALAAFDTALRYDPKNTNVLNNKVWLLVSMGNMYLLQSKYGSAHSSYQSALATFETVLEHAPNLIYAHNNKGLALQGIGDVLKRLGQHRQAIVWYQRASVVFDTALDQAPDYIIAYNNKGVTLTYKGDSQVHLAQYDEAIESYMQALVAYDMVQERAPNSSYVYNNKCMVLYSLGDVQAKLGRYTAAMESYEHALTASCVALQLAPDLVEARSNKGVVFRSKGNVQVDLMQYKSAFISYTQAITTFDFALKRSPTYIYALNNKGLTLIDLGTMLNRLGKKKDVLQVLLAALVAFNQSLSLAPNDTNIRNQLDKVQQWVDELSLSTSSVKNIWLQGSALNKYG